MWKLLTLIKNEIPAAGYPGNEKRTLDDNINIFDGPDGNVSKLATF